MQATKKKAKERSCRTMDKNTKNGVATQATKIQTIVTQYYVQVQRLIS